MKDEAFHCRDRFTPRLAAVIASLSALCLLSAGAVEPATSRLTGTAPFTTPETAFRNPIGVGADPWVIRDSSRDRFLWAQSYRDRGVAIHSSSSPASLGQRHIVWRAPSDGPYSDQIWAPELHFLDKRWYIYFAASDGRNENHRTYVLESKTSDPLGDYALHGPLGTGTGPTGTTPNIWAIDMTVLDQKGRRYAIWSGWDTPRSDRQFLYIAPLASPFRLGGPRVQICANDDYLWERVGETREGRGLHEAPQVLQRADRTFVVYSCSGSWQPTYKLGMLELKPGADPLKPESWVKHPQPVFQSTATTFGLGHCSFAKSPDGLEDWLIYHVKTERAEGWRRVLFAQRFDWTADNWPRFGQPVDWGQLVALPSGEKALAKTSASLPAEEAQAEIR
jgi:GH43 family beta-xylosidase